MAAVSTVVAVGLLAYGAYESSEAASDQRKASRAQKRANAIATAQGQADDAAKRRANVRKERVRRAQVLQASQAQGTTGSSGEIGAQSALTTGVASANAAIRGTQNTNMFVSQFNQVAADAMSDASEHQALANLAFQGASFGFQQSGKK
mgnify:CR=1 FL=1